MKKTLLGLFSGLYVALATIATTVGMWPSLSLAEGSQRFILGSGGGLAPTFASTFSNLAATAPTPPGMTYASAGLRYYYDAAGALQTSPNNQVRNSTMQGAVLGVVGSGGALPTGWLCGCIGLTATVVGQGVVSSLPYIDVNFAGTTTSQYLDIHTSSFVATSVSPGQTLFSSMYVALLSGTTTNVGATEVLTNVSNSGGSPFDNGGQYFAISPTLTRYGAAFTAPATTVYADAEFGLNMSAANGQALNVTIRLAAPQMEQVTGAQTTPNPFMPTSGAAYFGPVLNDHNPATLAALGMRTEPSRTNLFLNNLAPVTQTIPVTNATTYTVSFYGSGSIALSGACVTTMTGAPNVRTSFTCTSASTSLTATVSGLSSTSYAQVEQVSFATTPILTYGSAVTVPADNWGFTGSTLAKLTSGSFCVAMDVYGEGNNGSGYPSIFYVSDGTINNRDVLLSGTSNYVYATVTAATLNMSPPTTYGGPFVGAVTRISAEFGTVNAYSYIGYPLQTFTGASLPVGMNSAGFPGAYEWFQQLVIYPSCTLPQVLKRGVTGASLTGN